MVIFHNQNSRHFNFVFSERLAVNAISAIEWMQRSQANAFNASACPGSFSQSLAMMHHLLMYLNHLKQIEIGKLATLNTYQN